MYYDVYALSSKRDATTVENFLSHFCDRSLLEPVVDRWIHVSANEKYHTPEVDIPLHFIAELIAYAVANLNHAFNYYTDEGIRDNIDCVIIQFTYDGKVVFGISVGCTQDAGGDNIAQAIQVEAEIRQVTGAYKSYIAGEYPPARDEEQFDTDVAMWKELRDSFEQDHTGKVIS
ncbi:hypothetical protein [Hymenobacter metallilatus]|uniref:Uncharacterized protein n=1 Tax=Hymenobacter metallilatus TaxID=2493666 RepID=A0A428IYF7_9BACT|nr:hypothetical protein [Hymenobacter metallilatus]RSK23968.1 hypothetical protein EI290_21510 [Hymenobacter metallilatus]